MEGVKIIRAKRQSCEVFSQPEKPAVETNSLKKLKKNRKTDKIK